MRLSQNSQPGVGMDVDKSRTDHVARGVYHPPGLQLGYVPPVNGDRVARNQHGSVKTGAAGSVDDEAVFDD